MLVVAIVQGPLTGATHRKQPVQPNLALDTCPRLPAIPPNHNPPTPDPPFLPSRGHARSSHVNSSGPSLVPGWASQRTGTIAANGTTPHNITLMNPKCARRLHRHHTGQPALERDHCCIPHLRVAPDHIKRLLALEGSSLDVDDPFAAFLRHALLRRHTHLGARSGLCRGEQRTKPRARTWQDYQV